MDDAQSGGDSYRLTSRFQTLWRWDAWRARPDLIAAMDDDGSSATAARWRETARAAAERHGVAFGDSRRFTIDLPTSVIDLVFRMGESSSAYDEIESPNTISMLTLWAQTDRAYTLVHAASLFDSMNSIEETWSAECDQALHKAGLDAKHARTVRAVLTLEPLENALNGGDLRVVAVA
jgi:hypothetical protein